jgi:hypothetical protein
MHQFLSLIFLFFCSISFGQFAIILDQGGFVNVRKNATIDGFIVDKLQNNHLVFCFENIGNWTNIDYQKSSNIQNGYIYKDRYKLISDYPKFKVINKTANSITLVKDSIEVTLTQGKFDRSKHQIYYFKKYPAFIELIDNQKFWGTDGYLPVLQYEKITLKIESKIIDLPEIALKGLYNPNLFYTEINIDEKTNTIFIHSINSDGAGGYCVIWKIVDGVYTERFVTHGF